MQVPLGLCLQKGHVVYLVGIQIQSESDSLYQSMDTTALRQSNALNLDFLTVCTCNLWSFFVQRGNTPVRTSRVWYSEECQRQLCIQTGLHQQLCKVKLGVFT